MKSRWRGGRCAGWRHAGALALIIGMASGCSPAGGSWQPWQSDAWYGYYYDNVMVSTAPAISRPFASAQQCLAAMRAYTRTSANWTGFACGLRCSPAKDGAVPDCGEVVH